MKSAAWMIAILSLVLLSPALAQEDPSNLTGNWILNEKMSDDFAEVMMKARGGGQERPEGGGGRGGGMGGGGRGGGGRGGGMGGGGRGGGGGDDADREARAKDREERMEQANKAYSRLEIFHEGIELNVTNGVEITRLLYTDGRELTIWTQQGEAKATANWQEQSLVVKSGKSLESVVSTRHYTLADEGRQLIMKESIHPPGQDETIDLTMVYDLEN